ncbi:MAG: primosomal protein [Robiginitomaculum sp.]|nr:MAG: primosomal protein [Robiginitomaculum sp.]
MTLLITETTDNIHTLVEAKANGEGKNYFIEGIIMQSSVQNRNGRIYPESVLMREVTRYTENYVNTNRAYGELGHPSGPTINLDRVSHMFTELRQEGSNVMGRAKVLDTPMGKIVKNLIDEGANLGISSRGMGSLKANKQGIMEVQSDFMLATAGDIVADPSAPQAFVKGIMEGVDWIYDVGASSWTSANTLDRIEESVKKMDSRELEENALKFFNSFIKSLA